MKKEEFFIEAEAYLRKSEKDVNCYAGDVESASRRLSKAACHHVTADGIHFSTTILHNQALTAVMHFTRRDLLDALMLMEETKPEVP